VKAFERGDRVNFKGAGRDWLGTISVRQLADGTKSIHPKNDSDKVYVVFDDTGVSIPMLTAQLELVSPKTPS
jgi:hypothetical protein